MKKKKHTHTDTYSPQQRGQGGIEREKESVIRCHCPLTHIQRLFSRAGFRRSPSGTESPRVEEKRPQTPTFDRLTNEPVKVLGGGKRGVEVTKVSLQPAQ